MAFVGLALATACGPGHSEDTSATTSGGSAGTTTAAPTTSGPVVTGAPGSSGSADTTDPQTTSGTTVDATVTSAGVSETSTTNADGITTSSTGVAPCEDTIGGDPGLEEVPGDNPKCADPQIEWLEDHVDCLVDCSTMTEIHGADAAAGLPVITQASFGVAYSVCGQGLALRFLRLGGLANPQVDFYMFLECGLDPWLGQYVITTTLPDNTPIETTLTIEGYSGDWISEDPIDPPRLFGSFSGHLAGPFEAERG